MYPGHWSTVFPDKAAAVHAVTGASVSYKELDDRSNQLAQLMYAQGLRKGDRVAIFMDNDLRYFDVIWATLRSGLYLTTANQYLTAEEAGYIIDNSESQVVVSIDRMAAVAEQLQPHCANVKRWLMGGSASAGWAAG